MEVEDLALASGISASLLQKAEAGHRKVTKRTVDAIAPIVNMSPSDRQQLLRIVELCEMDPGRGGEPEPTPHDLRVLDANPFPACYMRPPSGLEGALHVIVATNAAFDRFFPGLVPGVSTVDYELLDPAAKDVFVHWGEDAHHLVRACRSQLTFVTEHRIEEIKAKLRQNPDFDGMWETPYPAHLESRDTVWVRDIDDGAAFEMHFRTSWDKSPWLHYGLTPMQLADYVKRYPIELPRQ
ncbi:hypothetical protein IU452_28695 [Nocardia transvalensis]|nr:hypothetical protein [Nocardia transvalensis]